MTTDTNPFIADNPFTDSKELDAGLTYSDFISRQIESMEAGPSGAIKIDCGNKSVGAARMTLRYVGNKTARRFKTKLHDGSLWVMKY